MNKDKLFALISMAKHIAIVCKYENYHKINLDSCINILKDAEEELQRSDWVSVKDKLPNINEDVIVCNQKNPYNCWISSRNSDNADIWKDKYGFLEEEQVTHWMPIKYLK